MLRNMEKCRRAILLPIIIFFSIATGIYHPAEAQTMFADPDIRSAIIADLKSNDAVPAHLIDVGVSDGVVTLEGSVFNILAADKAVTVARSIKGVRSVVSLIEVNPVKRPDEEIRQDVAAVLAMDPATDRLEITVAVNGGRVILSGKVDSVAEKLLCEEVAKGVMGVNSIENNIIAAVRVNRPDSEIRADVERLLASDVLVNAENIKVTVKDGVVGLSGEVASAIERTEATSRAWVSGVKAVDNKLEVRWDSAAASFARRQHVTRTDTEIEAAMRDAFLYDPRLQAFNVDVDSDSGTVTLRGRVDNYQAKMAAEKDARNTTGVWSVINEIDVRPEPLVNDDLIVRKVQEAFARNPYLERHEFMVESYNGNVFLYGTTNTPFEKEEAGRAAGSVPGVVDVQNVISVRKQWPYRNDREIKRDIESQLFWSPFVDSDAITVSVDEGVATLVGTVDNWTEYTLAAENAFEGGARSVKNHLQVGVVSAR